MPPFIWSNSAQTGIADGQFDFVYESWGYFYWAWKETVERRLLSPDELTQLTHKLMVEWLRILKIKGYLRFGPLPAQGDQEILKRVLRSISQAGVPRIERSPLASYYFVEVQRIK